mgnify:CR=1 FL=1
MAPFSRVRHTTPSRRMTTRSQKEAAKESWGHHEDGGLQGFLGLFKGANHRPAGLAVQVAGGFVRQDQQGMVDERPGHGGTLLLTAGDLRRVFVPDGGDTEYIAQLVRPGLRLAGDAPPMMAGRRMFSRTVRPSSSRKSWNTKPSCRLRTFAKASSLRFASCRSPSMISPLSMGM